MSRDNEYELDQQSKPIAVSEERPAYGYGDNPGIRNRLRADAVFRWLRSCAVCHSIKPPIDLLCPNCQTVLEALMNRGAGLLQEGYPFPVYSLLTWTPETERVVRPFAHAFKKGRAVRAAQHLVQLLSFERHSHSEAGDLGFVLPPRSKASSRDHSWLLGTLLSEHWGFPLYDILEVEPRLKPMGLYRPFKSFMTSELNQKRLKAEERAERRFLTKTQGTLPEPKTWVFVDDVITTGSTAMAAYMALGDPARFEVWALVNRPKLARFSSF